MRRYKTIFSTFHMVYRLIITSSNIKNFAMGICKLCKNAFKADKVVMVCKNIDSQGIMKVRIEDKFQRINKGGISILTKREREILRQEKEILLNNRMIYPFIFSDTLGAIYVKRRSSLRGFNDIEKSWFLSLCEEISLSLKIFNLYREEKKIIISYIKSLTKLLDQYVPTSYLHSRTTLYLIKMIGKVLNLSEAEVKSLEYASLLHDAGKIHLPTRLLKKEAPLTGEEFKIMMRHPLKGVELIKDLEILKPVIPIILHHHERFDGKGYPSKISREEIPLASRILAVLDAFDAMYFGRPYRKRKSLSEIRKELEAQKGKQFDPKIVDAFLKILKRKSTIKYLHSLI